MSRSACSRSRSTAIPAYSMSTRIDCRGSSTSLSSATPRPELFEQDTVQLPDRGGGAVCQFLHGRVLQTVHGQLIGAAVLDEVPVQKRALRSVRAKALPGQEQIGLQCGVPDDTVEFPLLTARPAVALNIVDDLLDRGVCQPFS